MIKITDFIHCYENIVDVEICKAIIDNSENLDFTKSSTVGGDAEYRKCYINDLHSKFKADGITIGGGSKIQIGADLVGYEGAGAVGASLKLRQVRVFDLKEYNGAGNFDWSTDDGFTMESSESYDSSDASMY